MKKDGALHMLGALAKKLSKKKEYKNNMEIVLVRHVFPEFQSEFGFLRARVRCLSSDSKDSMHSVSCEEITASGCNKLSSMQFKS